MQILIDDLLAFTKVTEESGQLVEVDLAAVVTEASLFYQESLYEAQGAITAGILLRYNGMLVGNYELFATRAEQVETEEKSTEALRDYWLTRTELERAVGGNLRARLPAPTAAK